MFAVDHDAVDGSVLREEEHLVRQTDYLAAIRVDDAAVRDDDDVAFWVLLQAWILPLLGVRT